MGATRTDSREFDWDCRGGSGERVLRGGDEELVRRLGGFGRFGEAIRTHGEGFAVQLAPYVNAALVVESME